MNQMSKNHVLTLLSWSPEVPKNIQMILYILRIRIRHSSYELISSYYKIQLLSSSCSNCNISLLIIELSYCKVKSYNLFEESLCIQ